MLYALDHLQIAIPPQQEDRARAFYVDVLGFTEVAKPASLANRGGCWFEQGNIKLHLGVEPDFRPARKAHPAMLTDDLNALIARCQAAGCELQRDVPLDGYDRIHVFDPFGNRIELMQNYENGINPRAKTKMDGAMA